MSEWVSEHNLHRYWTHANGWTKTDKLDKSIKHMASLYTVQHWKPQKSFENVLWQTSWGHFQSDHNHIRCNSQMWNVVIHGKHLICLCVCLRRMPVSSSLTLMYDTKMYKVIRKPCSDSGFANITSIRTTVFLLTLCWTSFQKELTYYQIGVCYHTYMRTEISHGQYYTFYFSEISFHWYYKLCVLSLHRKSISWIDFNPYP